MNSNANKIKEIIKKCQHSSEFFIDNYCKVKHPNAGIRPFKLFKYQKKCLKEFKEHRFNIFGKTRQCFVAGSPVWIPNGPKSIEKIKPGDEIYTFNNNTKLLEITKVSDTFDNNIRETVEVKTKTGHYSVCTPDHKFLTVNGWIEAKDLTTNDILIEINYQHKYNTIDISKNRTRGQILSVKPLSKEKVYDLEVPPYNNFIVDGAVVHNSGISTLSGAFALWLAMFFKNKTILIVSKRDKDAKEFLTRNIKFVHKNLPKWMQMIWAPTIDNEHELGFSNGSKITSLPSGPDTLRANSSSLNIIDEAAFCPHMEAMYAGGSPTLQHGGNLIVISTSKGIGNWYWKTWTDACEKINEFNPIIIDWWEMDWVIEYVDDVSNQPVRIAPTDGIRPCETKEEKEMYGPYWSPWLESQRKQLTEKGDDHKFRQEVLRDFLGSGNTVLSRETLLSIRDQADKDKYKTVSQVDYVHPINGESYHLDFQDRLWIWNEPEQDHIYSMGVDISSGESNDWSGIEIFNLITGEQVAELQIKTTPRDLSVMADYLGRWYNHAFMVPERTGMGVTVCQDLDKMSYPSIFRKGMTPSANKKTLSSQNSGPIGFNTTGMGKPIINKALIDCLGEGGYKIKSMRLLKQVETYVHLGGNRTGAEKGSLNDDLVLAAGLAFVGINLAIGRENTGLIPFNQNAKLNTPSEQIDISQIKDFDAIMPFGHLNQMNQESNYQEIELNNFTNSLLVPIIDRKLPTIAKKKNLL